MSTTPPSTPPNLRTVPISEAVSSRKNNWTQEEWVTRLGPYFESQTPVVLRGAVSQADAVYCWKSFEYLELAVGRDTLCQVELGTSYTEDSTQREILFGDYIDYLKLWNERLTDTGGPAAASSSSSSDVVYLAQNDLFAGLKQDVPIPAFCQDGSETVGLGRLYNTMIWLGPPGATSQLHFDPLDNLLMQFQGCKRVLLYPPNLPSEWLYLGRQYNTSQVEDLGTNTIDSRRFPDFLNNMPPAVECAELGLGDVLYIPAKWWHFVQTLPQGISASVNIWWR